MIRIRDAGADGSLSVDLIDLLRLVGPAAAASYWKCAGVEAFGPLATELHHAADHGRTLTGTDLLHIAGGVFQVVDGAFEATAGQGRAPWLRIRAVDSSEFVVVTDDSSVLARIRATYNDVAVSLTDHGDVLE